MVAKAQLALVQPFKADNKRWEASSWQQRSACYTRLVVVVVSCCLLPSILSRQELDVILDADGHASQDTGLYRCCIAGDCVSKQPDQKHAVVTSVRSEDYAIMLHDLHCSVRVHNPFVDFIVLGVAGELSLEAISDIKEYAEYREVPNIEYENTCEPRYSKNWFKLNVWNMTEYASIIMLDADLVIMQDLSHIFSLPTDFAWSYLNAPDKYNYNAGGFIMLRPCQMVFEHMLKVLELDTSKRFTEAFAEQSFFEWYFEYTGLRLPMIYNANFDFLTEFGLTVSGVSPMVVHFATPWAKPFNVTEGDSRWKYMCHRYRQHHRQHSPLFEYIGLRQLQHQFELRRHV